MATFTLDSSTLSGNQYKTSVVPDMGGPGREFQFAFYNANSGEDFEVHALEVHFTVTGVSKEDL